MTDSNSNIRLSGPRTAALCLAAVLAAPWTLASAQQTGGSLPQSGTGHPGNDQPGNGLDFRWLTEGGAPTTATADPILGGTASGAPGMGPRSGSLGESGFRLLDPQEVRRGGRVDETGFSLPPSSTLSLRLAVPGADDESDPAPAESSSAPSSPPAETVRSEGEAVRSEADGQVDTEPRDRAAAVPDRDPAPVAATATLPADGGEPAETGSSGQWRATSETDADGSDGSGVTSETAGIRPAPGIAGPRTRRTLDSDSGLRADLTGGTAESTMRGDAQDTDSDDTPAATGAPLPIARAADADRAKSGERPGDDRMPVDDVDAVATGNTDPVAPNRRDMASEQAGQQELVVTGQPAVGGSASSVDAAGPSDLSQPRAHVAAPLGMASDSVGGRPPGRSRSSETASRQQARIAAPALDGPGPEPSLAGSGVAGTGASGGSSSPAGRLNFGRAAPTKGNLGGLPVPVLAAASTGGIDDPRVAPDRTEATGAGSGAGADAIDRAAPGAAGPVPEPRLDLQPRTVSPEPALLAPAPVSDRSLLQAQATPGAAPTPLFGRMDEEAGRGGGRRDPVVEVDELDAVDIGSVGLLDESKGGLTADLWNGAQRGPVEAMLTRLPVTSTSATVQDLMRLLLLSISAAPEPAPGRKADPTRYVAMRIARLIDMGALEQAYDLARLLPGRLEDPNLDRLRIQAGLLAGRLDDACRDADRALRLYTDVFFARVQVFCETRRGETEKAFLGLSLLRETGDADPLFAGLIEKLLGGAQSDAPDPEALGPLMMRLYLDAGRAYPPAVASSGSFGYQRLFLDNQLNGQETRLLVAETLVAASVVPSDRLRVIYNDMSFSPDELSAATSGTGPASGPRARAAVHKAATNAGAPAQKAALIQRNLDLASSTENYQALILANAPIVRLLRPGESLAWFADEAARLLIYSGRRDPAMPWLALQTARPAAGVPTAADSEAEMPAWLLARLAGVRDSLAGWSPERLRTWAERQKQIGTPASQRRLTLGMTLLRAFGEPVDWPSQPLRDTLTRQAGNDATSPQALALRSGSAAVQKQVGLAVLYAILALGDRGPAQTDVVVLDQIIRSLNYIGLDGVARRMAVEAAVVWAR